jgi:hypothetical protein
MVKDILLKVGQKINREKLEKQGWFLLMHLPNGNEVFCRYDIKIIWDPQQEEVVHLFTSTDTYRLSKKI